MFSVFLVFVAVFISLLFIQFVTVHCKTNFLVTFYWDNEDSDSDSDSELSIKDLFTQPKPHLAYENIYLMIILVG